jgi:transposase
MAKGDRTPSGAYAQDWSAYNKAKTNEKRYFRTLLYEMCQCLEQPEQSRGRPRLPLAEVIFCIVFKIYSTYASRKFMSDASDAHDLGFIGHVPHFNSLSRYLKLAWLTPVLTRLIELSSLPLVPFELNFAVDSTGFSTDRYARWLDERTSEEVSRRKWVKVHLICGVKTHVVTSVIVEWGHDSQFFGRLVAATKRNFRMEEISADAGYISGENMRHAVLAGATPFIAFRSNFRLDDDYKSTIWKRMLSMFLEEHGRFLAHYNKRNNVETVFSMIKANFGDYVRGRDERAQVNEALAKVLCHNLCALIQSIYELGIEPKFEAIINPDEEAKKGPEKLEPIAEGRIVAGTTKPRPCLVENSRPRIARKGAGADPNQLSLFKEGQEEQQSLAPQGKLF